jgi:hypothetical protein
MAKKWKIIIGVAVALVVVACVAVPIVGAVLFRGRMHAFGWEPEEMHRWEPGEIQHHELEVELVDDDGDGVPDRGVIELPEGMPFARGLFGYFGPGRGMRFSGRAFGPFFFVGGLIRLAFLAGVIVLGVVFYRKWRKAHPVTPPAAE